ncbi:nucleoside-diphosphate-sugar epimerase [Aliiruegeria haliotis]|uniref:Nucleoside-diphosphate-sugar epimerase n=1 Tax=Aliiruegeria haliotis TaxID=1280846 RepID=A0A2T0RTB9_9RHOB|nr:SDR family oxidoreductase [Aliiruegeria haliotis]PRY24411.1 nucleoside-diphosphate-sugar epimerase [Aliiruegeria haliotis]
MTNTLLTLGHGYSARALVEHLRSGDWHFIGTTRAVREAGAGQDGVDLRIWPGSDLTDAILSASHILISAAPSDSGDPFLAELSDTLSRARPDWLGYLSTTGVYGDHDGGWVDEATPLTPTTRRGKQRVLAESQWRAFSDQHGIPLHVFRLAGIYGPGRGPFAKVRAGTARRIIKPGQVFSRIHVEDIAQILAASIRHPSPGGVYNVCDDLAAPPEDVIAHAANLLGMPVPDAEAFEAADMTPMARSFYAESKRVRNDRIKQELGVRLRFPDYRSGLADLVARAHAK